MRKPVGGGCRGAHLNSRVSCANATTADTGAGFQLWRSCTVSAPACGRPLERRSEPHFLAHHIANFGRSRRISKIGRAVAEIRCRKVATILLPPTVSAPRHATLFEHGSEFLRVSREVQGAVVHGRTRSYQAQLLMTLTQSCLMWRSCAVLAPARRGPPMRRRLRRLKLLERKG